MSWPNNQLKSNYNENRRRSSIKPVIRSVYNEKLVPTVSLAIKEYLRESTIHGLKFLLEPQWWQKIFWIVAIVIGVAMAVYFNVQVSVQQNDKV